MNHAGSIHIFTICFKIQQIEDILRYLGEDDNQESAPPSRTWCTNDLTSAIVSIDLSYCTQQEDGNFL
jgi:hypothetical protein